MLLLVRVANTVCLPTLQPDRVFLPVSRGCVHAFGLGDAGQDFALMVGGLEDGEGWSGDLRGSYFLHGKARGRAGFTLGSFPTEGLVILR